MKIIKIIALVILGLIIIGLMVRFYYNWRAARRPEASQFAQGMVDSLPNGFYKGKATVSQGSWQGKKFEAATGINVFAEGDRYKFHMYPGGSLTNPQQAVLKIDYNQDGNPWWLRFVVDEIVETAPGHFLGKIQINVVPHLAITIGYFTLAQ